MPETNPTRRSGGGLRFVLLGCGLLLAVVAAAYVWTGIRVAATVGHLEAARDAGERAVAADGADDRGALVAAAADLTSQLAAADAAAADPTWAVAARAPMLGGDFDAVQTLARALGAALPNTEPLLAALRGDAADPRALGAALAPLSDQASHALDALGSIDTTALLPPVAAAVERTRTLLADALPALRTAAALAPLNAAVSGDEPTRILVMLQNNAELRTGGGITGAYLQITADGGTFSLDAQASSSDFTARRTPVADVPDAMTALYGDVVGRFPQNASMPADFQVTATLAAAWWQQRGGAAPDVVVSLDPVVLVSVLRVVGPVALADGSVLTADDAISRLLVEPYRTLDSDGQTALMQDAAARIFAQLTAAPSDALAWAAALSGPVAEGRISAWAADPDIAQALAAGPLGGPAARLDAAGPQAYGVWFNDGTGGKMGGYLDVGMQIASAQCRLDGRADVVVRLTMTSTAPADAATALPGDVTGRGMYGTGVGDIGTSVAVAAPPGTFLASVTKAGAPARIAQATEMGRPTSLLRVNLSPGERNVVEFRFVSADAGRADPVVVHTPLLNPIRTAATTVLDCG
ncbi:DUF4012 domain-containing protein [Microbacterium telephonicum]|uniref:Uncharacterized protein DUF4012 n=1 Tax=Microbacterium telephonicum TaxID=1714841 RepID=A0A498C1K0_9MICO|nr:DUF4012 domain-containing protein [Microbacterium telephonicum]RLK49475.1 uncharacterized protein DUF4012 [Microbacterium telephonicum]